MDNDLTLENEWQADVMEQHYYNFRYEGILFCIYLRWRYNDSWSVDLVIINDKSSLSSLKNYWEDINLDMGFKKPELEYLKEHAKDACVAHLDRRRKEFNRLRHGRYKVFYNK